MARRKKLSNVIPAELVAMPLEDLYKLESQRKRPGEWARLVAARDEAQKAVDDFRNRSLEITRAITAKLQEALNNEHKRTGGANQQ